MKKVVFQGACTALITPTNEKGVDYVALKKLIDWQIESGINAILVCGTTGESATMSESEQRNVIERSVEYSSGRVPVIAGIGSNNTAHAVENARFAASVGADAGLAVTPYYNKATQKGLIAHYNAIADASDLPVILYNVPSRTGVNIEPETYAELAKHPNIVGYKEASGNLSKVVVESALVGDGMAMYSGNDDQTVAMMSVGAKGVISVLSNLLPAEVTKMCAYALSGDYANAKDMQLKYLELANLLFCEVNPIPVKAAMSAMGYCENFLRLPLTKLEKVHEDKLFDAMRNVGIQIKDGVKI